MIKTIKKSLTESKFYLEQLLENQSALESIAQASECIASALSGGQRVFSFGNGGSMSDAMHFAEELSGRFRESRRALAAVAISDPGYLSCVANDFGYDHVFSRYLEAHATAGDVVLAISTSGKSANVLRAAEWATQHNIHLIALCGNEQSPLAQCAEYAICTPGGRYADRVQELHIKVIHCMIEAIEARLFPD